LGLSKEYEKGGNFGALDFQQGVARLVRLQQKETLTMAMLSSLFPSRCRNQSNTTAYPPLNK
jgi:hypothetical protein